ncbi:MAG TPA: M67 family metallopeptidase [Actinomycetota bacterium]|nr:M67 family metallopeptidase [Actinomycetota bacterium]
MNKPDLQMTRALADEMVEHCRAWYPKEGCGMLAMKDGEIVKVFKMTNTENSPVRYALHGKEQLAAENTIAANGWELGGIFHSHTHTEAVPSPTDVRKAIEPVPYVIVSFADDPPSIRAFWINKADPQDEDGEVEEIPVVVIG